MTNDLIMDEVTIHVNMISTFMKDEIFLNVERKFTVVVELNGHGMTNTKAGKDSLDSLQFTSSISH